MNVNLCPSARLDLDVPMELLSSDVVSLPLIAKDPIVLKRTTTDDAREGRGQNPLARPIDLKTRQFPQLSSSSKLTSGRAILVSLGLNRRPLSRLTPGGTARI